MFYPHTDAREAEVEAAIQYEIKNRVETLLLKHKIPVERWGKGQAKTLDHLVKEVMEGETVLNEEPNGELLRIVTVASIDVFYKDPSGKKFRLTEEKQIFKDGRERRRTLDGSVAEKLKATELPDQATVDRAMKEELQIEGPFIAATKGTQEIKQDSPSYPGLQMKLRQHRFEVELNHTQYKPEGYIERQKDKDNYMVWKEVGKQDEQKT